MASKTSNIDLDSYCRQEIPRHEPAVDSPFLTGAISGAWIAFCVCLSLNYGPGQYASMSAGRSWSFNDDASTLLFWTVVLGGLYGAATLSLLSVTAGRLRVTMDAARLGFVTGGIAGAVFGASLVVGRELASSSTGFRLNWNLYSAEITVSALAFAAIGALLSSIVFAIWRRPRRPLDGPANLSFVHDGDRLIAAPRFDRIARFGDRSKQRFQFGLKQMLMLTAFIAAWISIPLFLYKQLLAIPLLKTRELEFTVFLIAVSLFLLPYGLWVVLRGPPAFSRLATAIAAWRELRRRAPESNFSASAGSNAE